VYVRDLAKRLALPPSVGIFIGEVAHFIEWEAFQSEMNAPIGFGSKEA